MVRLYLDGVEGVGTLHLIFLYNCIAQRRLSVIYYGINPQSIGGLEIYVKVILPPATHYVGILIPLHIQLFTTGYPPLLCIQSISV